MSRLSITVLAVEDVDAAAAFYERAFGWPRGASVPGVWVELVSSSTHHVGFYRRDGFGSQVGLIPPGRPPAGAITATELYVLVEDLGGAVERLRALGATQTSPRARRPWGDETAYFRDRDGNVVAVATPLPGD